MTGLGFHEPVRCRSSRALPVSAFRAAGFSLRDFSLFEVSPRAMDPAYENGKCSREAPIGVVPMPKADRRKRRSNCSAG